MSCALISTWCGDDRGSSLPTRRVPTSIAVCGRRTLHGWTRSSSFCLREWALIRPSHLRVSFTTRVLLKVILFRLQILRQRFINLVFCKRSIAWVVRENLQVLSRPSILMQAVVVSSSLGSAAPKKDDALICPATDRAKGGDPLAFLTEEARLRLEERLRDAGLRAALLVLGQTPPFRQRPSQAPPQSSPRSRASSVRNASPGRCAACVPSASNRRGLDSVSPLAW
jgi:hypothetical protein